MRKRLAAALLIALGFVGSPALGDQANHSAPGELRSQRNEPVHDILPAKAQVKRHPPAQDKTLILTCLYERPSEMPIGSEVVHYWLGAEPEWLATSLDKDFLRTVLKGVAANCPATLPGWAHDSTKAQSQPSRSAVPDLGNGTVKLTFVDGIPSCLSFWDQPNDCSPVSKELVDDWSSAYYQ